MVQQKQQMQKLQQTQLGQPVAGDSGHSSTSNSQADMHPSSQSSQQPSPNMYPLGQQHAPMQQAPFMQQQQAHPFVPASVNMPMAMQPSGYMGQPQHPPQHQPQHQPGMYNTFNPSPQPPNMGGFPSQLGTGQLLTPINAVNVNVTDLTGNHGPVMNNMPSGYPGSNVHHMNTTSGPHPPQLGNNVNNMNSMGMYNNNTGVNMHAPNMNMNMQANMAANLAANMASNRPNNTVIFNSSANQQGQLTSNNMGSNMNAAASIAAKKPVAAQKRTADKAGLDNTDKKAPKKRNPPATKPGAGPGGLIPGMLGAPGQVGTLGQGQGPSQGSMLNMANNINRPLNVPGGTSMFANLMQQGSMQGAAAQPPTAAQEIESMTERLNSAQEGIEPVGDNAAAAPLITPDFVRQEAELSRGNLRMSLPSQGAMVGMPQGQSQGSLGAFEAQGRIPIPGASQGMGPPTSASPHDVTPAWQFSNIADRGMLGRAAVQVLEGTDIKIGVSSLSALSNGIQQHLKNVLESAYKVSKSRANKTAINSYEGIYRMIVDHGKGHALPENAQNIAIRWGEDVRTILHAEENAARKALKQYDTALEEDLDAKMRAFDEERARSGNKRKVGAEADVPWWTKEVCYQLVYFLVIVCTDVGEQSLHRIDGTQESAEKAGLLGWSDLALVGFKNSVARKHDLGSYAVTGKRNARAASSKAAVKAEAGDGAGAASAEATLSTGPSAALQHVLNPHVSSETQLQQASAPPSVASAMVPVSEEAGSSAHTESAAQPPDYTMQSCPLAASRATHVLLQEEDLAATLARSVGNRSLPGGVLSSIRPTGTCLYKYKMGAYTGSS